MRVLERPSGLSARSLGTIVGLRTSTIHMSCSRVRHCGGVSGGAEDWQVWLSRSQTPLFRSSLAVGLRFPPLSGCDRKHLSGARPARRSRNSAASLRGARRGQLMRTRHTAAERRTWARNYRCKTFARTPAFSLQALCPKDIRTQRSWHEKPGSLLRQPVKTSVQRDQCPTAEKRE